MQIRTRAEACSEIARETGLECEGCIYRSLARAFSWAELLESGKVQSVAELARALYVDGSYISRTLKLTTLAPDIIEAILNGVEPDGLSLSKLVLSFPLDWEEQRAHFGFKAAER